jgi:hypothetical protein
MLLCRLAVSGIFAGRSVNVPKLVFGDWINFRCDGLLLIAREWRWAINLQGAEKVRTVGEMGEKARGRRTPWDKDEPKYMLQGWFSEFRIRRRLFRVGTILIILGFLGQLLGSWPHLFKSC